MPCKHAELMMIEFIPGHNKNGRYFVAVMQMDLCIGNIQIIDTGNVYFDTHDCNPMINNIEDHESILTKMKELQGDSNGTG